MAAPRSAHTPLSLAHSECPNPSTPGERKPLQAPTETPPSVDRCSCSAFHQMLQGHILMSQQESYQTGRQVVPRHLLLVTSGHGTTGRLQSWERQEKPHKYRSSCLHQTCWFRGAGGDKALGQGGVGGVVVQELRMDVISEEASDGER